MDVVRGVPPPRAERGEPAGAPPPGSEPGTGGAGGRAGGPVVRLWRRRTIVCQQWVEMVTDYLEGALPRRLQEAAERHLAACPHCREYLAQMRRTITLSRQLRGEDVPDEVVDALAAAF